MYKLIGAILYCLAISGAANANLIDRGSGMIYDDVLNITWLKNANFAKTELSDSRVLSIIESVNLTLPWVNWPANHPLTPDDFEKGADGQFTGLMTWWGATAWASQLNYGGYNDWRLPTIYSTTTYCNSSNWAFSGGDCGFNSRTVSDGAVFSELAYMYYGNLGFMPYFAPDSTGIPRTDWGIFENGTSNGIDNTSYGQRDVGMFENLQAYMYGLGKTNESGNHQWVFFTLYGEQSMVDSSSKAFAWAVRDGDVASIPEPSTMLLVLAASLSLVGARYCCKRAS